MNAFELMAGRLVCERLSNIDLRVMEGIVKGLDDCHDNGDLEGYFELNTEFHGRTIALSGNGVLTQVYADMFGKLQRARNQVNYDQRTLEEIFKRASLDHGGTRASEVRNLVAGSRSTMNALPRQS